MGVVPSSQVRMLRTLEVTFGGKFAGEGEPPLKVARKVRNGPVPRTAQRGPAEALLSVYTVQYKYGWGEN